MRSVVTRSAGPARGRRVPDAGVTLVEILVVLSIMAVLAGITALALPAVNRRATLRQEAELLATRLDIAVEHSLVSGRSSALDWNVDGYQFVERTRDGWLEHSNSNLANWHGIPGTLGLNEPSGVTGGRVYLLSDMSLPEGKLTMLELTSGDTRLLIRFDGASAQVISE